MTIIFLRGAALAAAAVGAAGAPANAADGARRGSRQRGIILKPLTS